MRREFPEDDEQPWTEEEWLEDMKRNDARADRFGELLETFMDHPDRDEIVAREMGWNDFADRLHDAKEQGVLKPDGEIDSAAADEEEASAPWEAEEAEDSDSALDRDEDEPEDVRGDLRVEDDEEEDEDDEPFPDGEPARKIPEFKLANRIGMKIFKLLEPYSKGEDDPTDGLLSEACGGAMIASAKIIGGHSLGYGKHYINGNIARQRIGLDAVDKSIRAFQQLKKGKFLPAKLVDSILVEMNELRTALADRIERLRARARRLQGKG